MRYDPFIPTPDSHLCSGPKFWGQSVGRGLWIRAPESIFFKQVTGSSSSSTSDLMPCRNEERENHVLLVTVINPAYPITCVSTGVGPWSRVMGVIVRQEVIHQICNPHGKVYRVVIFKKNGIQAMVEFDCIESAKRAKVNLHGCDIYSGCCTLRIEYAKVWFLCRTVLLSDTCSPSLADETQRLQERQRKL